MSDPRSGSRPADDRRLTAGVMLRSNSRGRLVVGFVLLILGLLWTLDNFGIMNSEAVLRWWPLILVGLGAYRMAGAGGRQKFFSGLLLLSAGLLLLLRETGVIRVNFWDLWPVFLMLVGASVVVRSLRNREAPVDAGERDSAERLDVFVFMGSVMRKSLSQQFRGGEVTSVMAGAEIDLRGARADGPVVIDVFTWWGGIDLIVPENWEVVTEVTPIMGGIDDKSRARGADAVTKLYVRGLVVMGGVEIKN